MQVATSGAWSDSLPVPIWGEHCPKCWKGLLCTLNTALPTGPRTPRARCKRESNLLVATLEIQHASRNRSMVWYASPKRRELSKVFQRVEQCLLPNKASHPWAGKVQARISPRANDETPPYSFSCTVPCTVHILLLVQCHVHTLIAPSSAYLALSHALCKFYSSCILWLHHPCPQHCPACILLQWERSDPSRTRVQCLLDTRQPGVCLQGFTQGCSLPRCWVCQALKVWDSALAVPWFVCWQKPPRKRH